MTMIQVGMHEAKTQLSKLVEQVEAGEDVVIARRGQPVVRLVRVAHAGGGMAAVRGSMKGRIQIADDFDELPAELREAFGA